eukprot:13808015-Ditylum_brightwellii.AAC.1
MENIASGVSSLYTFAFVTQTTFSEHCLLCGAALVEDLDLFLGSSVVCPLRMSEEKRRRKQNSNRKKQNTIKHWLLHHHDMMERAMQ